MSIKTIFGALSFLGTCQMHLKKYANSLLQKIASGKKYAGNYLTDKEKDFVKKQNLIF